MANEEENKFNRPRWYARDVQARVGEILGNAKGSGGVRGAMVAFLAARQDKLPEGATAEATVETILKSVDAFALANADGKTSADIRELLQDSVSQMSGAEALTFLTAVESAFRACDAQGANGSRIPNEEVLAAQIRQALEETSPEEVSTRIDALANLVEGDSLKAFALAAGNEALKDAICGSEIAVELDPDVASRLHEAITAGVDKADTYAATACAVYGMALEGKIPGVDAKAINPEVMTALVAAGMEKASILTRLMRGEIDAELARELLEELGRALKWTLVKALQATVIIGSFVSTAVTIEVFGWAALAGPILVLSLLVGVTAAVAMGEDFEAAVDFLADLTETAFSLVGSGIKWVWDKIASVASESQTIRATAT